MKLTSLDLNLLVALDALLDEESVTRAAERLFVGQPAMSATLAKLRSIFNDPLLVREGRGLRRTPTAEGLRAPLTRILVDIQHLIDSSHDFDPATSDRVFTIVASDYVGVVLLRPVLEYLATAAPQVEIVVRPVQPGLLDDLARGVADLVIYPAGLLPRNHPFNTRVLFEDHFVCVADSQHPDLDGELSVEQFATLPFLGANQGIMRSIAEEHLDANGHQ
ncbi:MAG: LysR family transcriptional regulator, partial [Propionibacteriaceae bacterium]|nr:LysR family transcriptional regulator [Propionibacteriaceae bacterium]